MVFVVACYDSCGKEPSGAFLLVLLPPTGMRWASTGNAMLVASAPMQILVEKFIRKSPCPRILSNAVSDVKVERGIDPLLTGANCLGVVPMNAN